MKYKLLTSTIPPMEVFFMRCGTKIPLEAGYIWPKQYSETLSTFVPFWYENLCVGFVYNARTSSNLIRLYQAEMDKGCKMAAIFYVVGYILREDFERRKVQDDGEYDESALTNAMFLVATLCNYLRWKNAKDVSPAKQVGFNFQGRTVGARARDLAWIAPGSRARLLLLPGVEEAAYFRTANYVMDYWDIPEEKKLIIAEHPLGKLFVGE